MQEVCGPWQAFATRRRRQGRRRRPRNRSCSPGPGPGRMRAEARARAADHSKRTGQQSSIREAFAGRSGGAGSGDTPIFGQAVVARPPLEGRDSLVGEGSTAPLEGRVPRRQQLARGRVRGQGQEQQEERRPIRQPQGQRPSAQGGCRAALPSVTQESGAERTSSSRSQSLLQLSGT